MADRPMSYQRAWKREHAAIRELEAERQTPGHDRVVDSINGFWIVEQPDGSYTIQRGMRVRFDPETGKPWPTREEAEAAAVRLAEEQNT